MKRNKILALILTLAILVMCFTGCGSIMNFDDFAGNAQNDAQQMADDIMNGMESINGFGDIFGTKPSEENAYKVIRVVDGDTFIVDVNGTETKVRLIGVDTPESVATGENAYKNCDEGKEASDFTKSLIEGKIVKLEYDIDKTDDYGRTLAYAYLEDGSMLNKVLLEKGYARLMTIQPNVKYANDFVQIQTNARENQVGFWKDFALWQED